MHEAILHARTRDQLGLVTRAQLLDGGVPRTTIDRWLESGRLVRALGGVYRLGGVARSWEQDLRAATLATGGIASHRSAARVWGLGDDHTIEVIVTAGGRRQRGVTVHRIDVGIKPSIRRGIPVTNPLDTLALLGAVTSREVVEGALHEALILRLATIKGAERAVALIEHPGRRGPATLRAILTDWTLGIRPPDSVLEIRFAAVSHRYSLPRAEFQFRVNLGRGEDARIDFAYPHVKLAVEVEGNARHTLPLDRERDRARKRRLTSLGWTVIEFSWLDIVQKPGNVARDIAHELSRLAA